MRDKESAVRKAFEQDTPPLYGVFEAGEPAVRCGGCRETFSVGEIAGHECADPAEPSMLVADGGGVNLHRDLAPFDFQVLLALRAIEQGYSREGTCYGLAIGREAKRLREQGGEVNSGQLYPSLERLERLGLVEISQADRRTNHYETTPLARQKIRAFVAWLTGFVDVGELDDDFEHDLVADLPANGGLDA